MVKYFRTRVYSWGLEFDMPKLEEIGHGAIAEVC
jgi:hypothetical protein